MLGQSIAILSAPIARPVGSIRAVICLLIMALILNLVAWPIPVVTAQGPAGTEQHTPTQPRDPNQARFSEGWESDGIPILIASCIDCHNEDLSEGGLDLSPFETFADVSVPEVRRVLEMVRFGAMPPDDAEPLSLDERKSFVAALESTIYSSRCDLHPRAGKVTVRRLNRSEYNRSVRDLFGIDFLPADDFPSDEVGAGFDNNSDVLSTSPILLEKYLAAADKVARAAILDPGTLPRLNLDVPGDQIPVYGEPVVGRFGGRFLDHDSFAWIDFETPFEGEYDIRVRGGTESDKQDPIRVAIYDQSGTLRGVKSLGYYGGGGSSKSFEVRIRLDQGRNRLLFVPIHDDQELVIGESKTDKAQAMDAKVVKETLDQLGDPVEPARRISSDEYPFMFRSFDVDGPRKIPDSVYPPKQWVLCRHVAPSSRGRFRDVEEYARRNLRDVMPMVFRDSVTDAEVNAYASLVKQMTDEGKSFHRGMQVAISALLVSPRFLFRVELPPKNAKADEYGDVALSPYQLASRLSYFLWSSTPDKELLEDARQDRLDEARLRRHVQRMLKDSRADALASDFAAQWLGLRNLFDHEADTDRFPAFDDQLRESMIRESETLFLHVLRENKPVGEFLSADYTFVDSALAKHYGVDQQYDPKDGSFQKVSLEKTPRRGLLAHASVLTLTSTPTRTSPVLRGKWILENILGIKAPEPPPGVPELEESKSTGEDASLRVQLELHRQNPTCASCHKVMDQLGFGLDDFDAIGKYRTHEGKAPIDSSGQLPDGRSFDGGVELSKMLGETESDSLARTIIERLLTFALGRELTPDDRCALDEIVDTTRADGYRLGDVIAAVVASRPFRFQSVSP